MRNQHFTVLIGNALRISIVEDEPQTANEVIHDQILACFEIGDPVLVWTGDGTDRGGRSSRLWSMTDGDPTVIDQGRKNRK